MANHPQDILWVYNPTTKPFSVKWGGVEYTLQSGEKKLLLRFIAEHFAKHLADAILMRMELENEKKTGKFVTMTNHPKHRPRILSIILPEVQTYFVEPRKSDASTVARMVDEVNKNVDQSTAPTPDVNQEEAIDFGLLPDIATGTLVEPPKLPDLDDTPDGELLESDQAKTEATPGEPVKRTRSELLKEALDLGLEVPARASRDEIEALIKKQFA